MNRWEAEKIVAIKAIKDPAFRKKLLADPKKALAEIDPLFAKMTDIQFKIIEEQQNEWTLVLPRTSLEFRNLSDDELSKLSAADKFFEGFM